MTFVSPARALEPSHGRLAQLLEQRFGLAAAGPPLSAAVEAVAAGHSLSPSDLLEGVAHDAALLREVAGYLGVPETYFFRNPEVFAELVRFIEGRLRQQSRVTVWSAGCCRGEEPYSLAVALDEQLGPGWQQRVALTGCDVSAEALATARAGVYGEWSFRGAVTDVRRQAAFERLAPGRWRVRAGLRGAVGFEHLSVQELVAALAPGSVDVFLFRNVAVYFVPHAVQPVYEAMAAALAADGLLCVAATDPQPAVAALTHQNLFTGVYQRRAPTQRLPPPSPSPAARFSAAPPPPAGSAPPSQTARQLADAGRVDEALALLERGEGSSMDDVARHLLRGQVCLGAGRVPGARDELRRVLYLKPEHLLGRYWLALTMARAGEAPGALAHLRELERQLRSRGDVDTLEDGQSTVRELRAELVRVKRQLT